MEDFNIYTLFYSKDTFSRQVISDLNDLGDTLIKRIFIDSQYTKTRILNALGDISIPTIMIKDADGKINLIEGSALQKYIRSLKNQVLSKVEEERKKESYMKSIEELNNLNISTNSNIEAADEQPTIEEGEDIASFQSKLQEWHSRRKENKPKKDSKKSVKASEVLSHIRDESNSR